MAENENDIPVVDPPPVDVTGHDSNSDQNGGDTSITNERDNNLNDAASAETEATDNRTGDDVTLSGNGGGATVGETAEQVEHRVQQQYAARL